MKILENESLTCLCVMLLIYANQDECWFISDYNVEVKPIVMDVCNIASTMRATLLLLSKFLDQQPTEIFLGAIFGW